MAQKVLVIGGPKTSQCQKPTGLLGRFVLWRMNRSHAGVTDWGLAQVAIEKDFTILDVGCGGGRTLGKLATRAQEGKVYGIDYSDQAVAASKRENARLIQTGRVEVRSGSVSQLPFQDGMFDLVTAVETHFWWPDLDGDMREVFRVLKPGGKLMVIAEVYKGASTMVSQLAERFASKSEMKLLSLEEHRELLAKSSFSEIEIIDERNQGWICAIGRRL